MPLFLSVTDLLCPFVCSISNAPLLQADAQAEIVSLNDLNDRHDQVFDQNEIYMNDLEAELSSTKECEVGTPMSCNTKHDSARAGH